MAPTMARRGSASSRMRHVPGTNKACPRHQATSRAKGVKTNRQIVTIAKGVVNITPKRVKEVDATDQPKKKLASVIRRVPVTRAPKLAKPTTSKREIATGANCPGPTKMRFR